MKKLLSVLLCAAMLAGVFTFTASAEAPVDKAMLMDDITIDDPSLTGRMGYIYNDRKTNDYGVTAWGTDKPYGVADPNGVSVAFDANFIATSECTHLISDDGSVSHVAGLVFTFSNTGDRQGIVYDAANQMFHLGTVNDFPTSEVTVDGSRYHESRKVEVKAGEWHRYFYSIQDTVVSVYFDGELVMSHDFDGGPNNTLNREFIMFWPSHCRMMMDNLIVGTDEYDDREDDTYNEGKILFKTDFNDAAEVTYDHVEIVPVYEYEYDKYGRTIPEDVYDEEGNQVFDDDGEAVKGPRLAREKNGDGTDKLVDGKPVYIQAKDDKGNLLFHEVYYYNVDGEIIKDDPGQKYAGFVFGHGVLPTSNVCYTAVDKATYCGAITDSDDAVISFADTKAAEGATVKAAITYDSTNAAFTSAQNLILSIDRIFTFKGFENVAEGASIEADENGKVSITLPSNFSGKIADIVLEIPAEKVSGDKTVAVEMGQSARYRYGFIVGEDTEFKNGDENADKTTVTIDGGFTYTQNYVKGDANGDGKVNAKDVILLMRYNLVMQDVIKGKTLSAKQQAIYDSVKVNAADVRPDGNINARDVTVLMKFIAFGEWLAK